jgi:hypothetical protein
MLKKTAAAAVLTVIAGWTGAAMAGESTYILDANNQVAVQFVSTNFDYEETVNGATFNTESNWVPGVGVSLSLMKNWGVRNLYFNAEFSWLNGKTDYVGAYQGEPFGSLKQKNGAIVHDYEFRLGKGFEFQQNLMVTPYFGIGTHEWNRKVNAGEIYSHKYYGGGLMVQYSPFPKFVLAANGLVGTTFDSEIEIKSIPDAGIVGSTLPLGDSTITKLGLSGDYAITRNIHVNAGVEWVNFDYGASPLDPTGRYNEPDSTTSNVTTKVGVGYAFGGGYQPLK